MKLTHGNIQHLKGHHLEYYPINENFQYEQKK